MRPAFILPNEHVLQDLCNGKWGDFASIKSQDDMDLACNLVDRHPDTYRVVRFTAGMPVVYPENAP